jgi:hypothetical protein
MRRKVRKKPEKEGEKEPEILIVEKEKSESSKKEKMTPIEMERQGMKPNDPGETMHPLTN